MVWRRGGERGEGVWRRGAVGGEGGRGVEEGGSGGRGGGVINGAIPLFSLS